MIPSQENIIEIAQYVLSTMVQMETSPIELREQETPQQITGCVQISGEWHGAVVLQTTHRFASQAASVMLDQPESSLTEEDLRDTLAEITNMIGGNIKSQVPGPSFLSIPSVTSGTDFDFRLKGASTLSSISLDCHNEPLRISLCQRDES